jgi:hypothetical protein
MRRTYGAIVIFGNRRASMLRVTQQVMRSHSPTKGTRVKRNESLNSCDNVLRVLRAAMMRSRTGWSEAGRSVPHRVALQSPAGDASVPLPPLRAISSWIAGSSSTTSAAGVSWPLQLGAFHSSFGRVAASAAALTETLLV